MSKSPSCGNNCENADEHYVNQDKHGKSVTLSSLQVQRVNCLFLSGLISISLPAPHPGVGFAFGIDINFLRDTQMLQAEWLTGLL